MTGRHAGAPQAPPVVQRPPAADRDWSPAAVAARAAGARAARPTVRRAYVWAFVSLLLSLSALLSAWPLFVALLYVVWRIHRGRI
jgi:hypothetical protein